MTEPYRLFQFPQEKVQVEMSSEAIKLTVPNETTMLSPDEALALAAALVESSAVADGNDPDELDWRKIPVQFLQFEAERESDEDSETEPEFASVRCWISAQTRTNAVHVASGWIRDNGWRVMNLIEQCAVTRADYENSDERQYYEQALTDGEVFVFEVDGPEDGDAG